MVVGGSIAQCSGASVTLQCTVVGNILIWNTPEGQFLLARGVSTGMNRSTYQSQLQVLNETHVRSNLTFTVNAEISVNCTDGCHAARNMSVKIEGIHVLYYNFGSIIYVCA